MALIAAIRKDRALIAEMDDKLPDAGHLYLWWLGQSGYLLQWNGKRVLIDPYLSDSLTRKYAATDKPHVRMSEIVVQPDLLRGISVITSSHNHTDHLDADTLIPVLQNNPGVPMIIPEANRDFVAARLQMDPQYFTGLNDHRSVSVEGFTFQGLPARHNELERDELGQCRYMGYVIAFGSYRIYHSGDTLWYDELPLHPELQGVDVALLPVNGYDPARRVPGNLDAREAVALGKAIHAGYVIPCHYDMFEFNTADVQDFIKEAEKESQPYRVLGGGEYFSA